MTGGMTGGIGSFQTSNKGSFHGGGAWRSCSQCSAWRGSLGLEPTPELYIEHIVAVFRQVRRVLRRDGTLWLNMGDGYASQGGSREYGSSDGGTGRGAAVAGVRSSPLGLKPKDLLGMPWRVALALQADGWYLRSEIIWAKPNPMPESVLDRPTKAHEHLFLLAKRERYYYDAEAIREQGTSGPSDLRKMEQQLPRIGGLYKDMVAPLMAASSATHIGQVRAVGSPMRNKRSVWTIASEPFSSQALHGGDGDSGRIVSPDCPFHGAPEARVRVGFGDALPGASQSDRNQDSDGDLSLGPLFERAPSHADPTSDRGDEASAMPHSRRNRRKGEGSAQHGSAGVEPEPHTAYKLAEQGGFASDARKPENRTAVGYAEGGSGSGHEEQTAGYNAYKCTCSIIDHFAVFPQALVEPCVLAGTSEAGCCATCGAPWVRVTVATGHINRREVAHVPGNSGTKTDSTMWAPTRQATNNWLPSCRCDAGDSVPCVVLDPFAGSGTTLYVAHRLGRRYVGIELNQDYVALARKRLEALPVGSLL